MVTERPMAMCWPASIALRPNRCMKTVGASWRRRVENQIKSQPIALVVAAKAAAQFARAPCAHLQH